MIAETCRCGASIKIDYSPFAHVGTSNGTGYRNIAEQDTVHAWRREHEHVEPVVPTRVVRVRRVRADS